MLMNNKLRHTSNQSGFREELRAYFDLCQAKRFQDLAVAQEPLPEAPHMFGRAEAA